MPSIFANKAMRASVETAVWLYDENKRIVSLRNYTGGVRVELYVDGSEVHRFKPAPVGVRRNKKFDLPDGRKGRMGVTFQGGYKYEYELTVDGVVVPRDIDIVEDADGGCTMWTPEDERIPHLAQCVSIPEVRIGTAHDGEVRH